MKRILLLWVFSAATAFADDANLTPQQIIAHMTNAYAICQSYQEVGEVTQITTATASSQIQAVVVLTNTQPFRIWFRRPSLLRFEFSHQEPPESVTANWPRIRCTLWSNGQQTHIYSEKTNAYWQGADLASGIVWVRKLSTGAGLFLDALESHPFVLWGLDSQHASLVREDEVDGVKCHVLSGNLGRIPVVMELWIGEKDFLLRKRRTILQSGRISSVLEETHRDVQINGTIPDSAFAVRLPEGAVETTNALSLLPDVQRAFASSGHKFNAAGGVIP